MYICLNSYSIPVLTPIISPISRPTTLNPIPTKQVMNMLLELGACTDARDTDEKCPLHIAAQLVTTNTHANTRKHLQTPANTRKHPQKPPRISANTRKHPQTHTAASTLPYSHKHSLHQCMTPLLTACLIPIPLYTPLPHPLHPLNPLHLLSACLINTITPYYIHHYSTPYTHYTLYITTLCRYNNVNSAPFCLPHYYPII